MHCSIDFDLDQRQCTPNAVSKTCSVLDSSAKRHRLGRLLKLKAIKNATENAEHSGYERPLWVESGR